MNHFYITLPSNSSEKYYHNNTPTHFITKLAKRFEFDQQHNWEVGLSEIILPQSWYNINAEDSIKVFCGNCIHATPAFPPNDAVIRSYEKFVRIQPGYYSSVKKLIEHINNMIEKTFSETVDEWEDPANGIRGIKVHKDYWPKMQYSETKKKVTVTLHGKMLMKLSQNLADILGFEKRDILNNTEEDFLPFRSTAIVNIDAGRDVLFIYADILEHIPVGDVLVPLLRIVDVENNSGDCNSKVLIRRTFDRPLYVPLRTHNFDTIEIHIKDDYGRDIPFGPGKLIVRLHFRQSKDSYFS